jgi:signal transduction histidine kinase/ActR/RegA family two-component response regulator
MEMSLKAKAYLVLVVASGISVLLNEMQVFRPADPFLFGTYAAFALAASTLKVGLPGVTGTMSVLFLFVLIALINLSLPETLLIAVASVFAQSFWRPKKPPKAIHIAFNVASLVIAIKAAHVAYTSWTFLPIEVLRLGAATVTFFVGNTLTVAVMIALTENRPVIRTWWAFYFWSVPYYLVGACLAGLFTYPPIITGWQRSILLLPVMYWIYRSHRTYLARLEEAQRHAEQLQQAANQLNAVLESTTDLVLATNFAGEITYVNERARSRLFQVDPTGVVLWEAFPKAASDSLPEELRNALRDRRSLTLEEEYFPRLKAWFDVHAYPSVEGIALYLNEVTEERELAEQLRQSQKMEAIGLLAGGMAHEFNNLLTIMLGYAQVLAETMDKNDVGQAAIAEVMKAGDRAAALTKRLLVFSRKQPVAPVVVNLNSVVSGIEGMLRGLIGRNVAIVVRLDGSICNIKADPNELEQVILNLAVNARDAMPNGGEVTISTHSITADASVAKSNGVEPGEFVVLSVRDTGTGMSTETKERIFEPFFTTKEAGKGTGLGLATVYGIVQQIGGYITVQSELGVGTTFQVQMPCVWDTADATPAEVRKMVQTGTAKILIVEDEEAVRELESRILTEAGHRVVAVGSAAEAMGIAKADLRTFDLLLTDIILSGRVSGVHVADELLKRHEDLKILYVSGHAGDAFKHADASAAVALMHKPFSKDELLLNVQNVLAGWGVVENKESELRSQESE